MDTPSSADPGVPDDDRTVIASTQRIAPPEPPLEAPQQQTHEPVALPPELPVGTRLGEFEITAMVGIGGFGIVYRAIDHSLGREVALKEYLPTSLASRNRQQGVTVTAARYRDSFQLGLRSFVNEAKILAKFDHPSLAKVHRFWEANGTAYMAMTFYHGRTLRQALEAMPGHAPMEWLRQLLGNLLDALEILHRDNYLHRDVAPDNILLLESGRPILLDLGAARLVLQDSQQALTVILKPGYAPPEQYAAGPSMQQGPWTDLYALAAVAYYAITGKSPMPSIGRMVHDGLTPLGTLAPAGYDAAFLEAIDRALSIQPAQRPQNAAEMRSALGLDAARAHDGPPVFATLQPSAPVAAEVAVAATEIVSPPPSPGARAAAGEDKRSGKGKWIAAAVGAVVVGAVAIGLAGRQAPPPAPVAGPSAPAPAPAPTVAAVPAEPPTAPSAPAAPSPAPDPRQILQQIHAQRDAAHAVAVTLDQASVQVGKDNLRFRIKSSKPGYVYILMVGTDSAHFNLLFPNGIDQNNRILGGQELKLPRPSWALTADGPPGTDSFVAIVSDQPRDFGAAGLRKVDAFAEFVLPLPGSAPAAGAATPYAGTPVCAGTQGCSAAYGAALFEIEEKK